MQRTSELVALSLMLAGSAAAQQPAGRPANPPTYGPIEWVEPDRTPLEGTSYRTFQSQVIHGEVNYLVYLPPDYEQNKTARYPVLYELPASGQTTKGGAEVVRRVDEAIRGGRIAPMIIVLVNGLRGNTMYCDSRDGKYPLESVIVRDLVPHVDARYRTVATREGRAVDGFSMGGYGAAHLGFKFPEVFGVISIMAPPLLGPELKQQLPSNAWSRLFPLAMGSDLEYFRANDPFTLAEKNAAALRDRTVIRIVCHWENEQWLWPQCEKLHQTLVKNLVQHEFYFLTNVKGHNRSQCLSTMGDAAFTFFSSSLLRPSANPPARNAPAPAPPRAAQPAAGNWEKLPDGSVGRETAFRGVDGLEIAAYIRKPNGPGPFPVIVWMHGGRDSKQATMALGRSQQVPVENLVKAGWAVYAADYRPSPEIAINAIEFDDTVETVKAARRLDFADPQRVGYMGQSHGGQVGSRVVSRVDLSGAVLCAPAAMDLVEVKKAIQNGEKLVPILSKLIGDMEKKYGAPAEEIEKNPAKYGYTSALTEAAGVRCPLLIMNGRNDDNSPSSMIASYVQKLRAAGKEVETYEPADGPHGFYFGRPEIPETQEAAKRAVAFFKKCFK
jgi:endo-1,4-beta-xylanase